MLEQLIARNRELATVCRRLDKSGIDQETQTALLEIAKDYDRRVADSERWLSESSDSSASPSGRTHGSN